MTTFNFLITHDQIRSQTIVTAKLVRSMKVCFHLHMKVVKSATLYLSNFIKQWNVVIGDEVRVKWNGYYC